MRKERDFAGDAHPCALHDMKHEEAATSAVTQVIEEARCTGSAFSIILCDIDHLEAVNAIHGRAAGDALLLQLFVRICEYVPVEDVIWESERADLVIIARNYTTSESYHLAETIRLRIANELFLVAQQPIMVTVSLGTRTFVPDPLTTAEEVLSSSEDQLEIGKRVGPNSIAPTIN